jgi:NADP-dependent 3-hydroxy acid dehydrogenase YdfG
MSDTRWQTALVSGAGSGVGRAVAHALYSRGLQVALLGRQRDKLEETAEPQGGPSARLRIEPCDVADREATGQAVARIADAFGSIDVLVSNAGINVARRSLEQLDPADWDRMIATNLTGSFNLAHFVLPEMRSRRRGLVVQICSISGMRASPLGGAGYSASKFGQAALGICLGREERARGIKSTIIYPGEINTPILDRRPVPVPAERKAQILQPEDVAAAVGFAVDLPLHASVPEIVLMPAVDDWV